MAQTARKSVSIDDAVIRSLKQVGPVTKKNAYKAARVVFHNLPLDLRLRLRGEPGDRDPIVAVEETLMRLATRRPKRVTFDYTNRGLPEQEVTIDVCQQNGKRRKGPKKQESRAPH